MSRDSYKIDFTTLNPIFSAITLSGSYGDSNASANSQIAMDATKAVFGSKLTMSGNAVKIGSGVSRVLVTAGVFYSGSTSSSYGWVRINKNGSDTGFTAIAYKSTSSYGSAVVPLAILDVQENDIISLYNLEASKIRGTATYLTVLAIG